MRTEKKTIYELYEIWRVNGQGLTGLEALYNQGVTDGQKMEREKQEPKEPKFIDEWLMEGVAGCCCGFNNLKRRYKYCPACGQKILWRR